MIKQIIFDCDGVLVDTEITAAQVVIDTLAEYNIPLTKDEYLKKYTGSTFSGTFKKLLSNLSIEQIHDIVERCERRVYEELQPIKGMAEVVSSLSLPVAVVSNSYLWQVDKALKVSGISESIANRYSSEQVENPKPAPDVYLLAAERTGYNPKECLVIEDSKSGVTAASAAGMTVIGFLGGSHIINGHGEALKEKGAKLTASTPQELLLLINELTTAS
ncbi:HAD family phosphatase [Fulvivirga sp. RKSG066]|uniref:HAD family hydrolase n=1 Tax=Fulvivirga aurantia TaxID=2529383 RepID=UPI0012BC49CC|nr:HAD family phosphatase [Fulvivirga aurantia]MTI22730.1 HAD family phosphatase [Fulvivirga aurantia]